MAMHKKASQARQASLTRQSVPLPLAATDRLDDVSGAQAANDAPHASLPTLRRSVKATQ
nr:hypothetical protein [uncultured Noviherbaspirillum sp.]